MLVFSSLPTASPRKIASRLLRGIWISALLLTSSAAGARGVLADVEGLFGQDTHVVVNVLWSQQCKPCKDPQKLAAWKHVSERLAQDKVLVRFIGVPMSRTADPGNLYDHTDGWTPQYRAGDWSDYQELVQSLWQGNDSLPVVYVWTWRLGEPKIFAKAAATPAKIEEEVKEVVKELPRLVLCHELEDHDQNALKCFSRDPETAKSYDPATEAAHDTAKKHVKQHLQSLGRIPIVAAADVQAAASAYRARSTGPQYSSRYQCEGGQFMAPNSVADIRINTAANEWTLELRIVDLESGCENSAWSKQPVKRFGAAQEAIDELLSVYRRPFSLRGRVEAPPVVPPPPPALEVPSGYVLVPSAGRSFEMSSRGVGSGWSPDSDEVPHEVKFTRSFLLKATEVTQGEWDAFVKWWNGQRGQSGAVNPSHFKSCGSNCPVESVNWYEAALYCNYLSTDEGLSPCYVLSDCNGKAPGAGMECKSVKFEGVGCRGYRLPTEAEWEYAARSGERAGGYPPRLTVTGVNNAPELSSIAVYGGNSGVSYSGGSDCSGWPEKAKASARCGPHPVQGDRQPNAFGLYDMIGNVWEWVHDAYQKDRSTLQPQDPVVEKGPARVVRGCSWDDFAQDCRAAVRDGLTPGYRVGIVGFRPSRSVP